MSKNEKGVLKNIFLHTFKIFKLVQKNVANPLDFLKIRIIVILSRLPDFCVLSTESCYSFSADDNIATLGEVFFFFHTSKPPFTMAFSLELGPVLGQLIKALDEFKASLGPQTEKKKEEQANNAFDNEWVTLDSDNDNDESDVPDESSDDAYEPESPDESSDDEPEAPNEPTNNDNDSKAPNEPADNDNDNNEPEAPNEPTNDDNDNNDSKAPDEPQYPQKALMNAIGNEDEQRINELLKSPHAAYYVGYVSPSKATPLYEALYMGWLDFAESMLKHFGRQTNLGIWEYRGRSIQVHALHYIYGKKTISRPAVDYMIDVKGKRKRLGALVVELMTPHELAEMLQTVIPFEQAEVYDMVLEKAKSVMEFEDFLKVFPCRLATPTTQDIFHVFMKHLPYVHPPKLEDAIRVFNCFEDRPSNNIVRETFLHLLFSLYKQV